MKHFLKFAGKKKSTEETEGSVAIFKKNQERWLWKNSFYKAYKKKDYATAEAIYLSREKYQSGITDVHVAFKLLKQSDYTQAVAVLSSILFLIFCLLAITKCIS